MVLPVDAEAWPLGLQDAPDRRAVVFGAGEELHKAVGIGHVQPCLPFEVVDGRPAEKRRALARLQLVFGGGGQVGAVSRMLKDADWFRNRPREMKFIFFSLHGEYSKLRAELISMTTAHDV